MAKRKSQTYQLRGERIRQARNRIRARERDQRRREIEMRQAARQQEANQRMQEKLQKQLATQNERERKELERFAKEQQIEFDREQKRLEKEEHEQYLADRLEETSDANDELVAKVKELQEILNFTLDIDDTIDFQTLRFTDEYEVLNPPAEVSQAKPKPENRTFTGSVKILGLIEKTLGMKSRFERRMASAEARYADMVRTWEIAERERKDKLSKIREENEQNRLAFELKKLQRNQEVEDLERNYMSGDEAAVVTYITMVLERSEYPDGFPQEMRAAYSQMTREAVIDYELPTAEVIPKVQEFSYNKSKDVIEERLRKDSEIKEMYRDVVSSVALRTIHEIFESDQAQHINSLVFNGSVSGVDPATGKDIRPCIISVRATKPAFTEINLARIDKQVCLRNLGVRISAQPDEKQAVKPVVEFDMVDKRFVDQADVLSTLDSRQNLMDLNPTEFEHLVSNLFTSLGLETRLTQASRDGGVDAVAFDTRPVIGGKIVIQAKRYKNTVGVSAVRDLYGTMQHEGASKGILVTTSSYGTDAYDFAKDKPLELIDGGHLLYLLQQVGFEVKIIMPDE